jgi:hypothetical protein
VRTLALVPALALALVGGCASSLHVNDRPLAHGGGSAITTPERDVVTDEAAWERLWANHSAAGAVLNPDGSPQPPPTVDFAKETVVAVFLGNEPNTCWGVRLAGAGVDGATLHVTVTTYRGDAPGVACGQAITQPFDMHAYSGSFDKGRVVFADESKQGPAP